VTAEHPYAALRAHEQRIAGMLADPECVGELLLVGMAMARAVDLNDPPFGEGLTLRTFGEMVYGRWRFHSAGLVLPSGMRVAGGNGAARVRDVVRADRRRYQPTDHHWAITCARPMVRRDGLCAKPATHYRRLTDPATGLRPYVGVCGNRLCRTWWGRPRRAEHPRTGRASAAGAGREYRRCSGTAPAGDRLVGDLAGRRFQLVAAAGGSAV
jgi:hypothetical protein